MGRRRVGNCFPSGRAMMHPPSTTPLAQAPTPRATLGGPRNRSSSEEREDRKDHNMNVRYTRWCETSIRGKYTAHSRVCFEGERQSTACLYDEAVSVSAGHPPLSTILHTLFPSLHDGCSTVDVAGAFHKPPKIDIRNQIPSSEAYRFSSRCHVHFRKSSAPRPRNSTPHIVTCIVRTLIVPNLS